jgi:hypothetical protein
MPTVPRLSGPQVQQAGMSNVRLDPSASKETFGGGQSAAQVESAASGLGEMAQKLALEEKKKADDVATKEAWLKTVQLKNDLMYNPKTGVVTKQGKDAFGVVDQYEPEFDKRAQAIEDGLSNESQKAHYREMRMSLKGELNGELNRHMSVETKKYATDVTESGIKTAQDDAVLNYQNPGKVQDSIRTQQALIVSHAQDHGMPPEWVKEKLAAVTSDTHQGVITRMLANGQDMEAKKYFDGVKDQIGNGKDITHIEKSLEEGSLRGESQRQSDAILSKGMDMSTSLAEARKVEDPKLRDAITERVKDRFQMKQMAERQDVEELHKRSTDIIDKTGDVDKIPPSDWQRFTLSERSALKSYAKQKREGIQPDTDWGEYYNLKTMASSTETKDKFLQMNLMALRPKFADTEFKELVGVQAALRKGDEKADKELDDFRTKHDIVAQSLRSHGFDPTPKDSNAKGAKTVADFYNSVAKEERQIFEATGKKATNEDIQKITDRLMTKTITDRGILWNTTKPLFQVQPGEKIEVNPKDIPRTDRAQIEEALKKRGIPVTEDRVKSLFQQNLMNKVKNGN